MMKILLIDDDNFLRDMYAIKFTEEGHEVSVAASGVEGMRIMEDTKDIDVVLVDMIMPGMNGIEFITKAKALADTTEVKFIVLSNQGQESDLEEATAAGADGYIIKAHSIPSEVVKKVLKHATA